MGRGPSIAGRKSATDAQRGKLFTKLIREVTMAVRLGGPDPQANHRLRLAMDKALDANMPKDTLERAIRRGAGGDGADATQEIRYEGYAPGGVAVMVDCMSDNPTRTVAEVRHAFSKNGGSLGTSGSVAYLFSECGQLLIETGADAAREERILELALEAGADDVISAHGYTEVLTTPAQFGAVKAALAASGQVFVEAGVVMRPANTVLVTGEDAEAVSSLITRLEELDDVQDVYTNAEWPVEAT
ncbi:MAG: YebC/PmpR family DNA-binding transcriptional regulator [Gammaproteobacteria bacterium]|jgi:YebC/PmpR family DNA-binding regulatory protein